MNDIPSLANEIQINYNCKCLWIGTVHVKEVFKGEVVWEGDVQEFELIDHPKAEKVYGWSYEDDEWEMYNMVLETAEIDTAEKAVKVANLAHLKRLKELK